MTIRAPFYPARGGNQVVTPAATSAEVTIDPKAKSVRLVNSGGNICHVRVGIGPQTATTADTPLRSNSEIILSKGEGEGNVAHISAAGTTLHIQPGEGGV
jgi:hypothetical protein